MTTADGHDRPATDPSTDELVVANIGAARRLARRYSHGVNADPDLVQVALVGLLLAAQRYDPTVGSFRPYAVATMIGELKKHLRSTGWSARVPRRVQEASITVNRAMERLEQELGRSPTPDELADATGLTTETVLLGLRARGVRFAATGPAVDPTVEDDLQAIESAIDVRSATEHLSEGDRELLALRFRDQLTQREIADELDMSQTQVHRRLRSILAGLETVLEAPRSRGSR